MALGLLAVPEQQVLRALQCVLLCVRELLTVGGAWPQKAAPQTDYNPLASAPFPIPPHPPPTPCRCASSFVHRPSNAADAGGNSCKQGGAWAGEVLGRVAQFLLVPRPRKPACFAHSCQLSPLLPCQVWGFTDRPTFGLGTLKMDKEGEDSKKE